MTQSESFGELRSLLSGPTHEGTWSRIVSLIAQWPDQTERDEQVIPYALDHLDRRWPDAVRRAPSAWIFSLMGPERVWRALPWSLVRTISARAPRLDVLARTGQDLDGAHVAGVLLDEGGVCEMTRVTRLALVDLDLSDEDGQRIVSHPRLDALTWLDLRGNQLGAASIWAASRSPQLDRLAYLDVRRNHWGGYEEAIRAIAASPHMSELEHLLIECDLTRTDLSDLLGSRRLTSLRHLALESCLHQVSVEGDDIQELGATALTHKPGLHALRSLSLSNNMLDDAEIEPLLASDWVSDLEALDLSWNDLGDRSAEAIAGRHQSASLRSLSLRGCPLTDAGAHALSTSRHLGALRHLDVSNTWNHGAPRLLGEVESPRYWIDALSGPQAALGALRSCNLSDLRLEWTERDVRALATSAPLRQVETLELANSAVRAEGAMALLATTLFGSVKSLNLNRNHGLGGALAEAISRLQMPSLRVLQVRECELRDEHVDLLCQSPQIEQLHRLDLRGNEISAQGLETLRRHPRLRTCLVLG